MGPLLLAIAVASANATGFIWIRVDPGLSVLLDGVPAGVSSVEESGCIVDHVPVGKHEVRVVSSEGRSAVFNVEVVSGQMVTVKVPTLALRAKLGPADSTIEVHLISDGQPCGVTIDTRTKMAPPDVVFDSVPPRRSPSDAVLRFVPDRSVIDGRGRAHAETRSGRRETQGENHR